MIDFDQEFAYTDVRNSCRAQYDLVRFCRRPVGHKEGHACGFGKNRVAWHDNDLDEAPAKFVTKE